MDEQDADRLKFLREHDEWKQRYEASDQTAKELFQEVSHITLNLTYDLIDKLRWWEKETIKLPDEEIEKRLKHMAVFLDSLKTAYLTFAEIDL